MAKGKKDRTPKEIAEIRRQRQHRRNMRASVVAGIWLAIFVAGYVLQSDALLWLAFILSMGNNIVLYGLYEKALRKIANRPAADYATIHKLRKRELRDASKPVVEE